MDTDETTGQHMSRMIREHTGRAQPAEDQADETEQVGNADFDGGARHTGPRPTDMNALIRRAAGF